MNENDDKIVGDQLVGRDNARLEQAPAPAVQALPLNRRRVFRVIDCESTGIPSATDPHGLVELGWTDVILPAPTAEGLELPIVTEPKSVLVNPGRAIPAEASAIHGIRDVDVRGERTPAEAIAEMMATAPDCFVAHEARFDQTFLGAAAAVAPWICTFKSALRVWEDAPNHKAQTLRYWLLVDDDPLFNPALAQAHHRAGPDSYATAWVFARLLGAAPIPDMLRWSSGPALLVTCHMNKHRGKRWREVAIRDPSYLHWILDKSEMDDPDIRATARYWLKNRPKTEATSNPY